MNKVPFRELDKGMGTAIANRTYFRKGEDWGDVAQRVSLGNSLLHSTGEQDRIALQDAIASGQFLTSGRHLQHGDETQPKRNLEVFSNCSTSSSSFVEFLLLLNGSGVGRNYSDEFMVTDWSFMPKVTLVLSKDHPDYTDHYRPSEWANICDIYHVVEDSREGWSKALEVLEVLTWKKQRNLKIIFDFSAIRRSGSPIAGMQNRPASGPIPLMYAFEKIIQIKKNKIQFYSFEAGKDVILELDNIEPWLQTMLIDHYAAECVVNGGARRSARIAVKYWKDSDILKFIALKKIYPWMWSSNNSVGVDEEFWNDAKIDGTKAKEIFDAICQHSFADGTGEPGTVNLDKLTAK